MNRPTVLIVDDDDGLREVLVELVETLLLDQHGCGRVHKAINGREALRVLEDHRPDLIFLDLCMPEWDGIQTFEYMSDSLGTQMPPTVFITGFAHCEAIKQRLQHAVSFGGAKAWYTKPISADQLNEILTSYLPRVGLGKSS
jgi:two-component system response regulator YesN